MKLTLDLREKQGRDGPYLFAALPAWNLILFVYPNGERHGVRQHELVIKPYTGGRPGNDQGDDFEGPWRDAEASGGPTRNSEGKTRPRTGRP